MSDNDRIRPVFLPAGVADPEKRIGYIADMPRGIEALDLGDARPLWLNGVSARPLIIKDNLLAALSMVQRKANELQLIVLDRNHDGRLLLESEPLVFPDPIFPSVAVTDAFRYGVSVQGNDLFLEWEGQSRYRGGAAPPTHIQAQTGRTLKGTVRINLDTGKAEMLPSKNGSDRELPAAFQAATVTEPWSVDDELAVIIVEIDEEQQTLQLQKWNPRTGQVYKPVPLITGVALVSYVTPDGCYLFIHSEAHTQSLWWLFSVKTEKQMALLTYEHGTREACVLDSRVYYIVEDVSMMKAVDIESGCLIWQHPLSPKPRRSRPPLRQ